MELIILIIVIIGVFLFIFIRGTIEEKKIKIKYRQKLIGQYGEFGPREYEEERWKSIKSIYEHCKNPDSIDDITWNDLEMDNIFKLIDQTQSSSGAEYLYWMLRNPKKEVSQLSEMESIINYLMNEEKQRVDIQMTLHELGTTGKYSLYDYIDYLDDVNRISNFKNWMGLIAFIVSIGLIFVNTPLGVGALVGVACYQIVTYLSEKSTITPYITSFSYIMRMLQCAKKLLQLNISSMGDFEKKLKENVDALKGFTKGYNALLQMQTSSGNPMEVIFDYIKMFTHFDIIVFNNTLNYVKTNIDKITDMALCIGYLDATISIGSFRKSLDRYCIPDLSEDYETLQIVDGSHPAIKDAVANSFEQTRGILITGSNASGKSTFLKMVAINSLLAQTIHTCCATSYKAPLFRIYSSMSLRDNLTGGESYYMVEIKALKRIMDAAMDTELPLLCFVDEVLRGTNTVERIAASTQILKSLSHKGIFCFAATHDIELTHLLEKYYDNYHFEEEVKDDDVLFSYRLMDGRANTRNAIKLLQIIGFNGEIIKEAEEMATNFITTGEW